jgi:hypothetical protein
MQLHLPPVIPAQAGIQQKIDFLQTVFEKTVKPYFNAASSSPRHSRASRNPAKK